MTGARPAFAHHRGGIDFIYGISGIYGYDGIETVPQAADIGGHVSENAEKQEEWEYQKPVPLPIASQRLKHAVKSQRDNRLIQERTPYQDVAIIGK